MPEIKTHLIKKVTKTPTICTSCNTQLPINTTYHIEEGVNQHLHSLIARRFCTKCYARYGEKQLLKK